MPATLPIPGVEAMQEDTARWQEALKNALAEADPRRARAKIETAEVAIFHRIDTFATGTNTLEEQALLDALDTIRSLKVRAASNRRVTWWW